MFIGLTDRDRHALIMWAAKRISWTLFTIASIIILAWCVRRV
jgi:hypothetical protein